MCLLLLLQSAAFTGNEFILWNLAHLTDRLFVGSFTGSWRHSHNCHDCCFVCEWNDGKPHYLAMMLMNLWCILPFLVFSGRERLGSWCVHAQLISQCRGSFRKNPWAQTTTRPSDGLLLCCLPFHCTPKSELPALNKTVKEWNSDMEACVLVSGAWSVRFLLILAKS